MLSAINCLNQSEKGTEFLNNLIKDNKILHEGKYIDIGKPQEGFSALESALLNLYQKYNENFKPGQSGMSDLFIQKILGHEIDENSNFDFKSLTHDVNSENGQVAWKSLKGMIRDHAFTTLYKGSESHYISVIEAFEENGQRKLKVIDSMYDDNPRVISFTPEDIANNFTSSDESVNSSYFSFYKANSEEKDA